MAKRGVTARADWTEFQKQKAADRKKVEATADKAVKTSEIINHPVDPENKIRQKFGQRRRVKHNTWIREPINGNSLVHSDIARHVIGLKISGYAAKEAFESAAQKFEKSPVTIERLYYDKPELFDLAQQEIMEGAMQEYQRNLWVCRSALSQAGPIAVDTMLNILHDKDASDNVRFKCAQAVLKMLDVDGSNNANPSERIAIESLKLVREATVPRINKEDDNSYILNADVEDADVVEDDAGESRTDSQLQ